MASVPGLARGIFSLYSITFLSSYPHSMFVPWHRPCVLNPVHGLSGGPMNGIFAAVLMSATTLCCRAVFYVFFLPGIFALSRAEAQTIWVPDDQPTIQAAINASMDQDTIFVRPGVYSENI